MDGTSEYKSVQKTSETKSENTCVNSKSVSTDTANQQHVTPANQQHVTRDKVSKKKRKRNVHKEQNESGNGDSSGELNGEIACSDQVKTASDTQVPQETHQEAMSSARPVEDKQIEAKEDCPDDWMSQGDGPDSRTSQGDGPVNGMSQGDGPVGVELPQQLEELHTLDGEVIPEHDVSAVADHGSEMSCKKRIEMYEKGQKLLRLGKNDIALKCFLQCLKGLEQHNTFPFLPQCLRSVADIYYKQEEYEKAVQFIQAEKMFYETSLIDTSTRQKVLEDRKNERDGSGEKQPSDPNADHPDVLRADEFENLARLCLQKNQSQLALEYQGKATKLRKKVYGDNHLVTMKSLDFFTVVYGEVGKQQYSESMERITAASAGGDSATPTTEEDTTVRYRPSPQQGREDVVQQAHFSETVEDATEHEEWLSRVLLWILFLLCIGCLSIIMFYLYCKVDVTSRSCDAWKADMNYHWMHIKYLYYSYMGAVKNKFTNSG